MYMRSKTMLCMAIAAVVPVAAGCASSGTTAPTATTTTNAAAGGAPAVGAVASSSVTASGGGAQFPIPTGYDANRNATADIRAALSLAKSSHKEVLLDFGADWCPDCVALDKMFHASQVTAILNSDYVVVPIDVGEWNLNISVAEQYVNLNTSGIPALVVISDSGQVREATNDGSFSNARYMDPNQVSSFLADWAPASSQ